MDTPPKNVAEYSVSEISAAVKRSVEDGFAYVRVRGEIRLSRPAFLRPPKDDKARRSTSAVDPGRTSRGGRKDDDGAIS